MGFIIIIIYWRERRAVNSADRKQETKCSKIFRFVVSKQSTISPSSGLTLASFSTGNAECPFINNQKCHTKNHGNVYNVQLIHYSQCIRFHGFFLDLKKEKTRMTQMCGERIVRMLLLFEKICFRKMTEDVHNRKDKNKKKNRNK